MLKIRIISIGKDKVPWITRAIEHYRKLLSRFARVEIVTLPAPRLSPSLSPEELRRKESATLADRSGGNCCVALSADGRHFDSPAFARFIDRLRTVSGGNVDFLIGGPHGLDDLILKKAYETISLSPLTLTHQMVRPILLEQIYRAFSILHNTGYHK